MVNMKKKESVLTVQVQDVAIFFGFNKDCIYGLTSKYCIEIGSLYGWPQQAIFNYIAGIVFVLIVDKHSIYEPSNLRLRPTCEPKRNRKKISETLTHKKKYTKITASTVNINTMTLFIRLFVFFCCCLSKFWFVQLFLQEKKMCYRIPVGPFFSTAMTQPVL